MAKARKVASTMAKRGSAPAVVKQPETPTNGYVNGPVNAYGNGHSAGHRLASVSARPDAPDDGRYVTKEEYWTTYYNHADASYEWNNGYLEAKPVSTLVQYRLFLWFLKLLHEYVTYYENAELMSLETGFTMTVPDPEKPGATKEVVRKPDLAAILRTNPVQWGEHDHSYEGICDLCVESLSDSNTQAILRDIKIKKSEYAFAGVQEYYILDPEDKHMVFYELVGKGAYVEIKADAEGVIRSNVLPGFGFRLRDLQRLPRFEELVMDPVYDYVMPTYRAALERIQQEQQRAQQEQQRAQQEQQRAERYAQHLRALGINVDEL
jgi:Uma2 family endonuclease